MPMETRNTEIDRNKRDEIIGKALASALVNAGAVGPCLSDEAMAALIDGTIPEPERDLLMKHLSGCDRCLEVFAASNRLIAEKTRPSRRSRYVVPAFGLAAAALLAIGIRITFQGGVTDKPVEIARKEHNSSDIHNRSDISVPALAPPALRGEVVAQYTPPSASETARLLAREADLPALLSALSSEISPVQGFSGAVPPEKRAFRLGVHAADLELFLRANEQAGAITHLKQIVELLRTYRHNETVTVKFAEILRKIDNGAPPGNFGDCSSFIEKVVVSKDELFLYRFGVWAEGGRLAAVAKNKDYVTRQSVKFAVDGVKEMKLPPGLRSALREIDSHARRGTFSPTDFLVMKGAFEDVIAIF